MFCWESFNELHVKRWGKIYNSTTLVRFDFHKKVLMIQRMFPEGSLETKILIVRLNLKHLQNFRLGLGALICKIEKKIRSHTGTDLRYPKIIELTLQRTKKIKWKGKFWYQLFECFETIETAENVHTTTQVAKEKIPLKCDTVINKYGWNFFRLHELSLCSNFCPLFLRLNEPFISFLKEPQKKPRKTSL